MSRKRNPIPTYKLHKKTGRARVRYYDSAGRRRDALLPGAYDSEESRTAYERLLAQLRANKGRMPVASKPPADLSVAELILRYVTEHATLYYVDRDTGQTTSELVAIYQAMRPLKRLYAHRPARDFGPLDLRKLAEVMASGSWLTDAERDKRRKASQPVGLARSTINRHLDRVKRVFRWGVSMELVPPHVLTALAAVPGLQKGRCEARETAEVAPVPIEDVEATLPHMPPVVADMVRVQVLTGARPGEVCSMRVRELDMTAPVWVYRPKKHKGSHRGHARQIAVGPRAQAVLRQYLKPSLDAYLFSPAEQAAVIAAAKRANRKTKVQPSQADRSKPAPKRKPGERFKVNAYNTAVGRACVRAGVEHWHVHRLRHTAALLFEREHGAEAARAALGHRTLNTTTFYSGIDLARAAEVAAKSG